MTEWDKLPNEMRQMIVQRTTENTRNALKACSLDSKALVEDTRLTNLPFLRIGIPEFQREKYMIEAFKSKSFCRANTDFQQFDTFEQFQNALTTILKSFDSIKTLEVCKMKSEIPLKLVSEFGKRILVEELSIQEQSEDQISNILSQMEPIHLRKIEIFFDWEDSSIYSMPQVVFAENIISYQKPSIREDQLLKLKTTRVKFPLIDFSLESYIQKCVLEATTVASNFWFYSYSGPTLKSKYSSSSTAEKVLLDTAHPQIKLELDFQQNFIKGQVRYSTDVSPDLWFYNQSMFRIIDKLKVIYDPITRCWITAINGRNIPKLDYKYATIMEAQNKLNEVMDRAHYIKVLKINMMDSPTKIEWRTRDKRLSIGWIEVLENNSEANIYELLQQVEPAHLKYVSFYSIAERDAIFDLPQMQQADSLCLRNSFPRDDQLLKLNAEVFRSYGLRPHNIITTSSLLNAVLKKMLANIEHKSYRYNFYNIPQVEVNETQLFESLNIISRNDVPGRIDSQICIDSSHPQFVLLVGIVHRCILIVRWLRNVDVRRNRIVTFD